MIEYTLVAHPATPPRGVRGVTVSAERVAADRLALHYAFAGDLDAVRWPAPAGAGFADVLWATTCCEAFVGGAGPGGGYREFNFSPSGRHAAYDFSGYRADMSAVRGAVLLSAFDRTAGTLRAEASVGELARGAQWALGLSVVVEERSGAKSFWALAHPPGAPDFHHAACFAATLAAPQPA